MILGLGWSSISPSGEQFSTRYGYESDLNEGFQSEGTKYKWIHREIEMRIRMYPLLSYCKPIRYWKSPFAFSSFSHDSFSLIGKHHFQWVSRCKYNVIFHYHSMNYVQMGEIKGHLRTFFQETKHFSSNYRQKEVSELKKILVDFGTDANQEEAWKRVRKKREKNPQIKWVPFIYPEGKKLFEMCWKDFFTINLTESETTSPYLFALLASIIIYVHSSRETSPISSLLS